MTQTAFRSTHDAVLAMWEFSAVEHQRWTDRMLAEQRRMGRQIFRKFSGLSRREEVVGIEWQLEQDNPRGWVKTAEHDFLVPASGMAGRPAREWLAAYQPPPRADERLRPFGLEDHHISQGTVFWPGLELLDDGLYVTWGVDTGWDGGDFFERVRLSKYHTAKERSTGVAAASSGC